MCLLPGNFHYLAFFSGMAKLFQPSIAFFPYEQQIKLLLPLNNQAIFFLQERKGPFRDGKWANGNGCAASEWWMLCAIDAIQEMPAAAAAAMAPIKNGPCGLCPPACQVNPPFPSLFHLE